MDVGNTRCRNEEATGLDNVLRATFLEKSVVHLSQKN